MMLEGLRAFSIPVGAVSDVLIFTFSNVSVLRFYGVDFGVPLGVCADAERTEMRRSIRQARILLMDPVVQNATVSF